MNKKRPVNLDLTTITFPVNAIASILHRITGMGMFILLPVMLYFLQLSLIDERSFNLLQVLFHQRCYQLLIWLFGAASIYHMLAGFRHVFMDFGWGDSPEKSRLSAFFVIIVAAILTIGLGLWLW